MVQYSLCHGMNIGTGDIVHWSAAPHHCKADRTGFWVCVVLVLNVIRCSCHYFLDIILFHHDFHHDSCDYHWDFMAINYLLIYTLGFLYISSSGSANAQLPGCFRPWTFSFLEYWIEHVSFGLLYVMFTFPTRIFYRGVPGFAIDCPCGIWCRGLTTCPLYIGPRFGNLV